MKNLILLLVLCLILSCRQDKLLRYDLKWHMRTVKAPIKTYIETDTLMALNDTLAYEGALIKLSSAIEVENYTNKSYPIIPIIFYKRYYRL